MTPDSRKTQEQTAAWVAAWRGAAREMEHHRAEEIRRTDTAQALRVFEGLLPAILVRRPPSPTSGLVEQQRLFGKLRHERAS